MAWKPAVRVVAGVQSTDNSDPWLGEVDEDNGVHGSPGRTRDETEAIEEAVECEGCVGESIRQSLEALCFLWKTS